MALFSRRRRAPSMLRGPSPAPATPSAADIHKHCWLLGFEQAKSFHADPPIRFSLFKHLALCRRYSCLPDLAAAVSQEQSA